MIEKLFIHRFRGIREGVVDNLKKHNIFVGPNNSGKTAILELLYLAATSGREINFIRPDIDSDKGSVKQATLPVKADFLGMEPLARLRRRHGLAQGWADNPAVIDENGDIQINLASISHKGEEMPWEQHILSPPVPEWSRYDTNAFHEDDIKKLAMFSIPFPDALESGMIPESFQSHGLDVKDARWHYLWQTDLVNNSRKNKPLDHLAVWVDIGQPSYSEHVLHIDFNVVNEPLPSAFTQWAYHNISGWYEKLSERLWRVYPSMHNAKVELADSSERKEGKTAYIRLPDCTPLLLDQFGDGARHSFKVLMTLTALEESVDDKHPGIFLWEEPELFHNPAALSRLLEEVVEITKDKPIQTFFVTHDIAVIAQLTRMLMKDDDLADNTHVFQSNLDAGILQASWFAVDNLVSWLEAGFDPRVMDDFDASLSFRLKGEEER